MFVGSPPSRTPPSATELAASLRHSAWDKHRSVLRSLRTQDQITLFLRARSANSAAEGLIADAQSAGLLPQVPLRHYRPSLALESSIQMFDFDSDSDEEEYLYSLPLEEALAELDTRTNELLLTSAKLEKATRSPHPTPTIRDLWEHRVRAVETLERAQRLTETALRQWQQKQQLSAHSVTSSAQVAPSRRLDRAQPNAANAASAAQDLAQAFNDALQLPLPET